MRHSRWLAALLLVALPAPEGRAAAVTLASLLAEMTDPAAIARWPDPESTCRQASSHDRSQVAPDRPGWFGNDDRDQFLRKERHRGRDEAVLLDVDGPGAIVRFWQVAGRPAPGRLRIYLDGEDEATLTFTAFDLLAGPLELPGELLWPHPGYRQGRGGATLYLPIPYARHCKVTWQQEAEGRVDCCYQINYRTYGAGAEVETFSLGGLAAAHEAIVRAAKTLAAPPAPSGGRSLSLSKLLPARGTEALDLPRGPAAVTLLELRLRARDPAEAERALRGTIVEMTFDGELTVWCPATDFFGSGVGINELRSWYRQVGDDEVMRCRWVMPYQRMGRIALSNAGMVPVHAELEATVEPWAWDARSMHFHSTWRHESGLATPPPRDWNYIKIRGRGVYAGDSLALFNPVATWYGEGDERIWVDGEPFPSHAGTGTEDYYGYTYAPKGIIQSPFVNQVRVDEPSTRGHNVLSRTRNLDGIPFGESLVLDLELISWRPTELTYAATTYWYAIPGATADVAPQPREAALPAPRLPEIVELEDARVVGRGPGDLAAEVHRLGDGWGGGAHLLVKATKPGDFVELEMEATGDGERDVVIHLTRAKDHGIVRLSLNGRVVATFDGYAESFSSVPLRVGVVDSGSNGRLNLRAEVVGANPRAIGARHYIGLDALWVRRPLTR